MTDVKALQCSSGHHVGHLHFTQSLKSGKCLRKCLLDHFCLRDWSSEPIVKLIGARHRESLHSWFIYCRFSEVLWWTDCSQVTISLFFFCCPCTLNFLLFPHLSFNAWLMLRLRCLNPWVHALWTNYASLMRYKTAKGFRARTHAYRTNLLSSLLKHDRQLPLRLDWFFSCLPQSCSWDTAKRQHAVDACWHFAIHSFLSALCHVCWDVLSRPQSLHFCAESDTHVRGTWWGNPPLLQDTVFCSMPRIFDATCLSLLLPQDMPAGMLLFNVWLAMAS